MATTATGVIVPAAPAAAASFRRRRELLEPGLSLRTFAAIRWTQIAGQTLAVFVVAFGLGLPLPLSPLLAAIALSAAVTLWAQRRLTPPRRLSATQLGLILAFDALQIGFLLCLTGALANPFALFLLFPAILAATTTSLGWCAAICATVVAVATFLGVRDVAFPWSTVAPEVLHLHVAGTWFAVSFGTVLAAGYAWRIAEEARRTSRALSATQLALEREQQLTHLDGLATAAAHDLGTPLTTISVLAGELVHETEPGTRAADDAAALHAQALRCREILARFTRDAPRRATTGQPIVPLSLLLERLRSEYDNHVIDVRFEIEHADATEEANFPLAGEMRHALSNLIDNAVRHATERVAIRLFVSGREQRIEIADDGPGFPPEVLASIGEPFISTRRGSNVHGLGLFIACTFLTRAGAELTFRNEHGGAVVSVRWVSAGTQR